jgi:hypothetical protein
MDGILVVGVATVTIKVVTVFYPHVLYGLIMATGAGNIWIRVDHERNRTCAVRLAVTDHAFNQQNAVLGLFPVLHYFWRDSCVASQAIRVFIRRDKVRSFTTVFRKGGTQIEEKASHAERYYYACKEYMFFSDGHQRNASLF